MENLLQGALPNPPKCIVKTMNLEKPKHLIIGMEGVLENKYMHLTL